MNDENGTSLQELEEWFEEDEREPEVVSPIQTDPAAKYAKSQLRVVRRYCQILWMTV